MFVATKALDGLFLVLGQGEKKIRTDPAARMTDLPKDVFGRKWGGRPALRARLRRGRFLRAVAVA